MITIQAYKSSGQCYRSWDAVVEAVSEAEVVTFAPAGNTVTSPDGIFIVNLAIRSYYWLDKPYNLLEVYRPDFSLEEVYIHIASPPVLQDKGLSYIDWELDVVRIPGKPISIVDEEEFLQASRVYKYSPEFCQACYQAAKDAKHLAFNWEPRGINT